MSINVTVNGNPVSIRRGRMVLSDLDQVKKNERDRRRKLRLEQVRQQSKEISNRLLERAKKVTKAQLTQLEKDGRSELRQMHDQKIMDLQRKYQEDMEDIGRAHVAASLEPDVEALLEIDRKKNRLIAAERGKEALQRLKETNQMDDVHAALHERQRQVREMENARASMVANLPKNSYPKNRSEVDSDSTGEDESVKKSPKKKRGRKSNKLHKSIPNVVVQSSDIQVIVSKPEAKRSEPQPGPSRVHRMETASKRSTVTNKTITDIADLPCVKTCCESDDQEPRQSLPIINLPSKADKVASYNPRDYKPDSASSTSSSSSPTTLSDDSSYFSDGAIDQMVSKKTPRHTTSAASSKVQLYDHTTRQRNAYNKPVGVVERINMNGEPNAEELARAVVESENADSRLVENRRRHAQRRGNDAILRERVRRDYQNLLQNLDHLAREERKLKASQIHGPVVKDIHLNPLRRQELLAKRQKDMDHAFETVAHDTSLEKVDDEFSRPSKRVVTIRPIDEQENMKGTPSAVWQEPPFFEPVQDYVEEEHKEEKEMSRDEQIFEMLRKVERQKRLLLKEFGADLPDNIFNASVKPLFSENTSTQTTVPTKTVEASPTPEIKVVNLSSCDEKEKCKAKKCKKKVKAPPKRIEIAVQTSVLDEKGAAMDKSVQVELINGKSSSSSKSTSEEVVGKLDTAEDVPRKNIAEAVSNSGSSDSVGAGIVIDLKKKQVKVTPRKKKSSLRLSRRNSPRVISKPRSVPGGKPSTPVKKTSRSAPVSKQCTPRSNISRVQPIKITDKEVQIQLDNGEIKVKINPSLNTEASRDTSTESSKGTSIETLRERIPVYKKPAKARDTSDTSTSYTSPPPPTPALYRSMRNNSTPILEILENSEVGSLRSKKRGISPVSSPGTPSPRTINLPTNTPHLRQINKLLEYFDSTISQSTDNTMSILFPGRQSTPNEMTSYSQKKSSFSDRLNRSPDVCSCKNPQCKLMHSEIRDIENYASKNYPEILQKYQDLQSMCTDRIASLTDLIEKVRNEQRGMEISAAGPSDESSMFQIPGPTPIRGDLQSVRKLVDSIEAIHNQLAKTLNESQRIIAADKISTQTPKLRSSSSGGAASTDAGPDSTIQGNLSTDAQSPTNDTRQEIPSRGIPRIISSERVNIPLSRFKGLPKQQTSLKVTVAESTSPSRRKSPRQEEDMVEKLSKEILEQSKALDNLVSENSLDYRDFISNQSPPVQLMTDSPTRHKSPSPEKLQTIPPTTQIGTSETATSKSQKDEDFIPLLAGIPKVQRMPASTSENHRPRPPVTLIYGPHRIQTGSPGHELSTIVEFDTPDTASRSQRSVRSPTTGKSRKNLIQNYQKSSGRPPSPSSTRSRSPVHTSSPLNQNSPPKSPTKKSIPSPTMQTAKQTSIPDQQNSKSSELKDKCEATCSSLPQDSLQKTVEISGTQTESFVPRKKSSSESSSSIPDISVELSKRNLIFHARIATTETDTPFQQKEQRQPITSASTEPDKDKITSTSSNSFSGLSGISEITSTPTSDILKYTSSPEEMEAALKKLGLGWAITTLKKTREASALSSSSNSDTTPINPSRKMISPVKKDLESKINCLPSLSDVSSISIKDANKSTERALLLKARTSTPNIENSNSSCEKPTSSTTNSSRASIQDQSDSLTAPNLSLNTKIIQDKQLNNRS